MKGKLKIWPGLMWPMTSPPQEWGHKWAVTNVSYLEFKYYSDGKAVADLVPDIFELEERPVVRVAFMLQGMSPIGRYHEVIFYIACKYKGKTYEYEPYLYVNQEAALIAGREPIGRPKLLAEVHFDPLAEQNTPLVTATLARPSNIPLAYGVFRPNGYVGRVEDMPEQGDPGIACVSIKNIPGREPLVDFCACKMVVQKGDIWSGVGSIAYTGYSGIDELHKMPVVEMIGSKMILNGVSSSDPASAEAFSVLEDILPAEYIEAYKRAKEGESND